MPTSVSSTTGSWRTLYLYKLANAKIVCLIRQLPDGELDHVAILIMKEGRHQMDFYQAAGGPGFCRWHQPSLPQATSCIREAISYCLRRWEDWPSNQHQEYRSHESEQHKERPSMTIQRKYLWSRQVYLSWQCGQQRLQDRQRLQVPNEQSQTRSKWDRDFEKDMRWIDHTLCNKIFHFILT